MTKRPPSPLPPALEMLAWTHAISLAESLFGKRPARALWQLSPLPQFTLAARDTRAQGAEAEGRACLAILAQWTPPGASECVASLVAAATNGDEVATAQLGGAGILVNLPGHFGFAAVCTTAGTARACWSATPFAVSWIKTLKSLSGVSTHTKRVRIAQGSKRGGGLAMALMLPVTLFNEGEAEAGSEFLDDARADIAAGKWLAEAMSGRFPD